MKLLKSMMGMAAALSMTALPVMASAAPVNPAAKLSLSPSVRTGAAAEKANKFGGGAVFGALILIGVAAIAVIAATKTDSTAAPKSP